VQLLSLKLDKTFDVGVDSAVLEFGGGLTRRRRRRALQSVVVDAVLSELSGATADGYHVYRLTACPTCEVLLHHHHHHHRCCLMNNNCIVWR
jgi:hypothetical protein